MNIETFIAIKIQLFLKS